MCKDSLLDVVSHLPFLYKNEIYINFKSDMWQPLLGVLKYQTFDQTIKSTHRTKMPLSVASSIQLFAVYLVSFDFIFIAQFNVETMKSSYQDERSVKDFSVAYCFQKVHLLCNFNGREFQASFEDRT